MVRYIYFNDNIYNYMITKNTPCTCENCSYKNCTCENCTCQNCTCENCSCKK